MKKENHVILKKSQCVVPVVIPPAMDMMHFFSYKNKSSIIYLRL